MVMCHKLKAWTWGFSSCSSMCANYSQVLLLHLHMLHVVLLLCQSDTYKEIHVPFVAHLRPNLHHPAAACAQTNLR
jgi:hypothetical protein